MTNGEPYTDYNQPGRFDINGVEWWACDPYPTWFRWEKREDGTTYLMTKAHHVRFADQPERTQGPHAMPPEECYGHDKHDAMCDGTVKTRWSGVRCDCGARWFCL